MTAEASSREFVPQCNVLDKNLNGTLTIRYEVNTDEWTPCT